MPDAIDTFTVGEKSYILTPNEGDARDYEAYSEEIKHWRYRGSNSIKC